MLTQEPDWSALRSGTPPAIVTLLRRCLRKDRSRRLADIADARLEIDEALEQPRPAMPANAPVTAPARGLLVAAGFLAVLIIGGVSTWAFNGNVYLRKAP